MLANGSSVVGRDPHYQAASLDRRRQEIQRRIDNLQERITGVVGAQQQYRNNKPVQAPSRQLSYQRPARPEAYQFTLSDQHRLSRGPGAKPNISPAEVILQQSRPVQRQPLQAINSQDEMNRLYDLVRSTLQGQSVIQSQLLQIRQDMKQLARDRTISMSNSVQAEGSPIVKHHQLEHLKKSNGSPADRLYSNDYRQTNPPKPSDKVNRPLAEAETGIANPTREQVSTTPFWHQSSRSNADTAHFNAREQQDRAAFYKPPKSKRVDQDRPSKRENLNHSEAIFTGKATSKVASSTTAALRKSPYVQQSASKNNARARTKSAKPTARPHQAPQLPDPPRGILKYPYYDQSKRPVQLPQHLQDLQRVFRNQKDDLNRTWNYSDRSRSRSIRRSKRHKVQVATEARSAYAEKIEQRLRDSKEQFLDASHKNAKHQHQHLTNTVELQRKLREDMLSRIHEMRDTKRYK